MFRGLIRLFVASTDRPHSVAVRVWATVLGASLFVAGWPALVYFFGTVFPSFAVRFLSVVFFLMGIPWMGWAVFWQLFRGKGTPVPFVPTRNFLSDGPYRYVRNPMILGYFFYLSGWAVVFNAAGGFGFAVLFFIFLLAEIKTIEEKELAQRFGEAYLDYKKKTPLIIPRKPK